MKLSKFDIERLEKILKALNDREAEIRSQYRVIQAHFMKDLKILSLGYVVASNKTGIVCMDYFSTEDAAWTWLFNV